MAINYQINIKPIQETNNEKITYRCPCCSKRVQKPHTDAKRGRPVGSGRGYIMERTDPESKAITEVIYKTLQDIVNNNNEFTHWVQASRLLRGVYKCTDRASKKYSHITIRSV